MRTTHLLYLHGFRSSPQSIKARQMAVWVSKNHPNVVWACPALLPSPVEAMAQIEALVNTALTNARQDAPADFEVAFNDVYTPVEA